MRANELRIGNWIHSLEDGDYQIEQLCRYSNTSKNQNIGALYRNGSIWTDLEYIEPIPLTEDWLMKFGFESNGDEHEEEFYHKKHDCFGVKFTNFVEDGIAHIWDASFTGAPIKYVHQLQNLVHALTGEELTVK